ncbi:hypothetical protein [Gracilibacillus alcaliphilus]|uniref:hypothetical protein n=1 Tax=Gracilibacillus alcaliphilus TaxID=1401441 RepID=UPI001956870B|nr:hypothetical protein [Gracilibacillus alcaliphilus]MBM7679818.1 F0F1-type ATP synthase assembly protein I [Gracilibacillus alcaliphilus]
MTWLNISFVALIIAGLLLFVYGLRENSQLSMLFGGIACLLSIFYFLGWTTMLPFVAPIALVISYLMKKKVNTA